MPPGLYAPKGGPTPQCGIDGGFLFDGLRTWPARGNFMDEAVAEGIAQLLGNASLLDVGAGSGQYGVWFHRRRQGGEPTPAWRGIDGARGVEAYTRTYGPPGAQTSFASLCDASEAHFGVYDWVMSLEVGEHIPPRCLTSYLHWLHASNRHGIVLSWSSDCSGGTCHISCRSDSEVITVFRFLNYEKDEVATKQLRAVATTSHLKRKLLVLRRRPEPTLRHGPHGLESLQGSVMRGTARTSV